MISRHPVLAILAALLVAPLCGALLMGLDRKLTARLQGRKGPPILQPFYDVLKLAWKEPVVVNQPQIVYAHLHLAFMMLTLVLVLLGEDALMVLFTLAVSTLALVMGGMCVRSPYSRIGSQREILLMVAYEPILILLVIGMYLAHGSFKFDAVLSAGRPMIASLPLLFVSFLVVVAIKLQKSPFDLATSHHAHQEIVKGITIEYSGPYLAILEIAHFYEIALLFALLTFFWATNLAVGMAIALVAMFAMVVLDNLAARLTSMWAFRFMWTLALGVALTNVVWLYLGRGR
jgi:formate hydrogenlyase subunit 4